MNIFDIVSLKERIKNTPSIKALPYDVDFIVSLRELTDTQGAHMFRLACEMNAEKRVVEELYEISKKGEYVYPSMGLALAHRVYELTGKSKLSK